MLTIVKAALIFHNMAVELRRDRYENELWIVLLKAVGRCMIIDSDIIENPLHWVSSKLEISPS